MSGIDSFVGADGVAATLLRPGGKVLIGGKMFDAMADSGYIEMDSKILVVAVRGNTLIVSKN
jgi:membrane-bound serine protease (ClpP class)